MAGRDADGPGRMVPDVAANADPNTGYEIILYCAATVVGGTSAVAPLYAGLFGSFGTKLGFVTPESYLSSAGLHDVIHGDNGAFRARMGADPCTGLGSPLEEILEERIQPAAIQASRVRTLLAENAVLHTLIAGKREQASAHGGTHSVPRMPTTRPGSLRWLPPICQSAAPVTISCPSGYRPAWDMATQQWICEKR